jgi:hypothetical protein
VIQAVIQAIMMNIGKQNNNKTRKLIMEGSGTPQVLDLDYNKPTLVCINYNAEEILSKQWFRAYDFHLRQRPLGSSIEYSLFK